MSGVRKEKNLIHFRNERLCISIEIRVTRNARRKIQWLAIRTDKKNAWDISYSVNNSKRFQLSDQIIPLDQASDPSGLVSGAKDLRNEIDKKETKIFFWKLQVK